MVNLIQQYKQINPIVKAYIISESLLWSAWNIVTPIFAIFVIQHIPGGSIEIAATSYSIYLIMRVLAEVGSGRYLFASNDREKFIISIVGIILLSVSYLGFALAQTVTSIFLFYGICGLGLGIASPAKNSLFSMHLDKNKEASEWGFADGIQFLCMAIAATVGGFVAQHFGFPALFTLAVFVNIFAILPYFVLAKK